MSDERSPQNNECPADVLGWIPWYPEGLAPEQCGAVEAHAASCNACRDEIAMLQGLSEAEAEGAPDPERIYAQVLARMESTSPRAAAAEETVGATVSRLPLREADPEPVSASRGERDEELDASTAVGWHRIAVSASIRRVALAASLLLALAVGALVGPPILAPEAIPDTEPVYETASASGLPAVAAGGATLDIVFREDASVSQINQTLRALGARVTSGPSQLGVYRLELGADVDLIAAKKLLTEDRDGVATFAEKPLL